MSLTPAQDQIEAQRKKDNIEKCGKNGGPHDYVPIEWKLINDVGVEGQALESKTERVTRFLCRVCFKNISTSVFVKNYEEIKT
jgi:hypothetical protein